jgi:hypothetical protein
MSVWSNQDQQGRTWWEPPRKVVVPRRPIGDLLRTSFRAYGRSFLPFLALSAMVVAAAAVVLVPAYLALADAEARLFAATPLTPTADTTAYQAALLQLEPEITVIGLILAIVTGLMGTLLSSAVIAGTPEAALGQPVRFAVAFRRFMAHLVPVIAVAAVLIAIQSGITIAGGVAQMVNPTFSTASTTDPSQLGSSLALGALIVITTVALGLLTLYLYLRWFVILPLIVVDGLGVRAAMRRSAQLTSGSRWYILGVLILLVLVMGALSIAVELVAALVGLMLGAGSISTALSVGPSGTFNSAAFGSLFGHLIVFTSVVGLLLTALYYPVIAIAMAILRSDFTWRDQTAAAMAAAAQAPGAQAAPAPPSPLAGA